MKSLYRKCALFVRRALALSRSLGMTNREKVDLLAFGHRDAGFSAGQLVEGLIGLGFFVGRVPGAPNIALPRMS